jgi:hypothetical protein
VVHVAADLCEGRFTSGAVAGEDERHAAKRRVAVVVPMRVVVRPHRLRSRRRDIARELIEQRPRQDLVSRHRGARVVPEPAPARLHREGARADQALDERAAPPRVRPARSRGRAGPLELVGDVEHTERLAIDPGELALRLLR